MMPSECLTVAICTYRRAEVAAAVASVQAQALPADLTLTIVVIDNDVTDEARGRVEALAGQGPWPVGYVHAPAQNISIARNAAMASTRTRWMAFLDDDETASPGWIAALWAAREGATAVFGPSHARYPEGAPSWAAACDFHSSLLVASPASLETGISGNALIDLDFVRKHRLAFATELGKSGGEDTVFFMMMRQHGAHLAYVPEAVVTEHPALSRVAMPWVFRRKFRAGQTYALMRLLRDPGQRWSVAASASAKAALSGAAALAFAWHAARMRWWAARGVFHAGVVARTFQNTALPQPGPAEERLAGRTAP